jgi:hypothetical protein
VSLYCWKLRMLMNKEQNTEKLRSISRPIK